MMPEQDLDDDYGRSFLHGHLDFTLLGYTKRLHEKPKTTYHVCRRKNCRCRVRPFWTSLGSYSCASVQCFGNCFSQIVPEPRLQNFTPRLALLSTERICRALQRFRTVSRPNGPLALNMLRFYMTLGETSITEIHLDTALLSLTKSCSACLWSKLQDSRWKGYEITEVVLDPRRNRCHCRWRWITPQFLSAIQKTAMRRAQVGKSKITPFKPLTLVKVSYRAAVNARRRNTARDGISPGTRKSIIY